VRHGARDAGTRDGPTAAEQRHVKALERNVRELRRDNDEILKLAIALLPRRVRTDDSTSPS